MARQPPNTADSLSSDAAVLRRAAPATTGVGMNYMDALEPCIEATMQAGMAIDSTVQ